MEFYVRRGLPAVVSKARTRAGLQEEPLRLCEAALSKAALQELPECLETDVVAYLMRIGELEFAVGGALDGHFPGARTADGELVES